MVHPHVCGEKPVLPALCVVADSVHPHVCGEKWVLIDKVRPPLGSSPRVWGKGRKEIIVENARGFIPTCVGKSFCFATNRYQGVVHPHVCGEKFCVCVF